MDTHDQNDGIGDFDPVYFLRRLIGGLDAVRGQFCDGGDQAGDLGTADRRNFEHLILGIGKKM
jgi:hypothetical protein